MENSDKIAKVLIAEMQQSGISEQQAKYCALIAVKHLINSAQYECHIQGAFNPTETSEFWEAVKIEINVFKPYVSEFTTHDTNRGQCSLCGSFNCRGECFK